MKKLSLLMFALLILGCGTEKPAVEEPPPIAIEEEPIGHSLVADSNVKNGAVNVDPATLSRGFYFKFTKPFYRYRVWLHKKDGTHLHWDSYTAGEWGRRDFVWINQILDHDPLQYNTEYEIVISAQNYDCDSTEIVIQFRTKPQPNLVKGPKLVMQEQPPAVALGEHFRFDIDEPRMVDSDVRHAEINVDPEPLNANGIHFELDRDLKRYKIDLRLNGGASLNWAPRDLVAGENVGRHIQIMPVEGSTLLEFDTNYAIDIFVHDLTCLGMGWQIWFRTKPKP